MDKMSKIKSIKKHKIKDETLWNLAIEGDESYIANGFAVHNCRSVLIPITKYEEWQQDDVTNSGENVEKFLEKNVAEKGFAVYAQEKPPQITDPNVEMLLECSGRSEITTYSLNGKPFQISICTYEDDAKTKIKSIEHKRLDEKN